MKVNDRLDVHKYILLACFYFVFTTHSYGQPENTYSISRSCLGASGATQTIATSNGHFNVSQSIGQAGVIGTYHQDGYTLLQGYQQPLLSIHKFQTTDVHQLKAVVYPNPFNESINIEFKEPIEGMVYVTVADMIGKTLFNQEYPSAPLLRLPLNTIPEGLYVVKVEADNRYLIVKQVKQ